MGERMKISDEMVEKAAKAICLARNAHDPDYSWELDLDAGLGEFYRSQARAVLEALGGEVVEARVIGKPPWDWSTAVPVSRRGTYMVIGPLEEKET